MLPRPTPEYVRSRLPLFRDYADADSAIELVFGAWPRNAELSQVLAKVVILNRLYSTSIYDVHGVARHIVSLDIDTDLCASDLGLVSRIASFIQSDGKSRYNYSFATKYCAWHSPGGYQIYDSRVDAAIWNYKKNFGFAAFRRYDLGDYETFMGIMGRFVEHFGLQEFSRKQLDKFLWIEAASLS